jgi:hypothetical protein
MIPFVRVIFAGAIKQLELMVIEIKGCASEFGGEFGGPGTMFWIGEFVDST